MKPLFLSLQSGWTQEDFRAVAFPPLAASFLLLGRRARLLRTRSLS